MHADRLRSSDHRRLVRIHVDPDHHLLPLQKEPGNDDAEDLGLDGGGGVRSQPDVSPKADINGAPIPGLVEHEADGHVVDDPAGDKASFTPGAGLLGDVLLEQFLRPLGRDGEERTAPGGGALRISLLEATKVERFANEELLTLTAAPDRHSFRVAHGVVILSLLRLPAPTNAARPAASDRCTTEHTADRSRQWSPG
ncbi:MAG: hypothetical protein M3Q71_22255, partial [Chloroflexota bacterium]|nr:hypothetical protein [Chloroflexota bacterium]